MDLTTSALPTLKDLLDAGVQLSAAQIAILERLLGIAETQADRIVQVEDRIASLEQQLAQLQG